MFRYQTKGSQQCIRRIHPLSPGDSVISSLVGDFQMGASVELPTLIDIFTSGRDATVICVAEIN